jgi:isopentenyldiphosphate isomerase
MCDEILDVVNEQDQVIGSMLKGDVDIEKLIFKNQAIRAVWLFIRNDHGKLWIPRRTKHKVLFPGGLDGSMAGHITQGETYEQALHREVAEELNIDLSKYEYKQLGYFSPFKNGLCAFTKVYELRSNESPKYNKDDFCEYFWLTPQEVLELIEGGEPAKSNLPLLIRLCYGARSSVG